MEDIQTSTWLMCCGCAMIMGSGGSTFQADTGYSVGGIPITQTQSVPPNVGGFLMGTALMICGYLMA